MKTLQIKPGEHAENGVVETVLWDGKTAKDVLREQYHDRCVMKPVEQARPVKAGVIRPITHAVYDRTDSEDRHDFREPIGALVELP